MAVALDDGCVRTFSSIQQRDSPSKTPISRYLRSGRPTKPSSESIRAQCGTLASNQLLVNVYPRELQDARWGVSAIADIGRKVTSRELHVQDIRTTMPSCW